MEYFPNWWSGSDNKKPTKVLKELPKPMKHEMWALFEGKGIAERAEGVYNTGALEARMSDLIVAIIDDRTQRNIYKLLDFLVSNKPFLEDYDSAEELKPVLKHRLIDFAESDGVKCAWQYAFLWPEDAKGERKVRVAYDQWLKTSTKEAVTA